MSAASASARAAGRRGDWSSAVIRCLSDSRSNSPALTRDAAAR
jgi:hypothetical protein